MFHLRLDYISCAHPSLSKKCIPFLLVSCGARDAGNHFSFGGASIFFLPLLPVRLTIMRSPLKSECVYSFSKREKAKAQCLSPKAVVPIMVLPESKRTYLLVPGFPRQSKGWHEWYRTETVCPWFRKGFSADPDGGLLPEEAEYLSKCLLPV